MKKGAKIDSIDKLASLMVGGFEELRDEFGRKVNALQHDLNHKIDSVQHGLNRKIDSAQHELGRKIDSLAGDVSQIKRDLSEVKTDLRTHGKAIDSDAKTIINHETRIKKLEHAR